MQKKMIKRLSILISIMMMFFLILPFTSAFASELKSENSEGQEAIGQVTESKVTNADDTDTNLQDSVQESVDEQDAVTTEGTDGKGDTSENGEYDQEVVEDEVIEETTNTVQGDQKEENQDANKIAEVSESEEDETTEATDTLVGATNVQEQTDNDHDEESQESTNSDDDIELSNDKGALSNVNVDEGKATFTVAEGKKVKLSFTSYGYPEDVTPESNGKPYEDQFVHDNKTDVYGPGNHTVTVTLPECGYFQTDLYFGDVIESLDANVGHPGHLLLGWDTGDTLDGCEESEEITITSKDDEGWSKALTDIKVKAGVVTFTVAEGERIELSFTSYGYPDGIVPEDNGKPYDKQIVHDNVTAVYGQGQHTVEVNLPECGYFQTDLYFGKVIENLNKDYGHPSNLLVGYDLGNTLGEECEVESPEPDVNLFNKIQLQLGDCLEYVDQAFLLFKTDSEVEKVNLSDLIDADGELDFEKTLNLLKEYDVTAFAGLALEIDGKVISFTTEDLDFSVTEGILTITIDCEVPDPEVPEQPDVNLFNKIQLQLGDCLEYIDQAFLLFETDTEVEKVNLSDLIDADGELDFEKTLNLLKEYDVTAFAGLALEIDDEVISFTTEDLDFSVTEGILTITIDCEVPDPEVPEQPVNAIGTINLDLIGCTEEMPEAVLVLKNETEIEFKEGELILDSQLLLEDVKGLKVYCGDMVKMFMFADLSDDHLSILNGQLTIVLDLSTEDKEDNQQENPIPVDNGGNNGGDSGTPGIDEDQKGWYGDKLPQTGDTARLYYYLLGMLFILGGAVSFRFNKAHS